MYTFTGEHLRGLDENCAPWHLITNITQKISQMVAIVKLDSNTYTHTDTHLGGDGQQEVVEGREVLTVSHHLPTPGHVHIVTLR